MKKHIVLARSGVFGTKDNPKEVTEQDLKEIAESFTDGTKAPITVTKEGHPQNENFPKFGDVVDVYYNEKDKTLDGTIEVHPVLENAMQEGFYNKWSIGAKQSAETGKMYLHHLAMLGEMPPAIKDIQEKTLTDFSLSDTKDIFFIECADSQSQQDFLQMQKQIKEFERANLIKSAEGKFPSGRMEKLLELADSIPIKQEILLSDNNGQQKTNIYRALATLFNYMPELVKTGVLLSDKEEIEDDFSNMKNILNKG